MQFARTLPLSRSRAPIDIESADGMIGRAARIRMTRQLAATGDTALLDYHLAAMRDIGAPPLLTGNRVDLLIDGPRTYQAMFAAIEQARDYILVESFIFEEASSGDRTLSALLTAASARGVHVYVLYDAVGSLTTDEKFLGGLGEAGIALCAFNPLNPLDERFAGLNQRDHRKIVVVDGNLAFAGGVNFSQAYRIASRQARRRGMSRQTSLHEGWRDTHVAIHGTAARQLERLFRGTWSEAKCPGEIQPPFSEQAVSAGSTLVQIVASTPRDETNDIYATLLSVITYAQRRIDVTMAYFVPDETLEKALMAAAQRGVIVRIILPSYSDFSGVFYAGRAHYDELLKSGVQLYELKSAFLHSKSIVVDGVWSSIGSTNFDWRSFVHNDEISVCVIDQGFAQQMSRMFDTDLADSRQITLAAWKKRGLLERFRELMWLPVQYWL
ncbi:MAG TPA: phospholipase D-like domain-containing protein [Steroidobacteraceae bacterium]|jgi:cardiolipin synthase|nr:phospholipase D-like domain-containing protein [Steroidobacteraceae bacterium]